MEKWIDALNAHDAARAAACFAEDYEDVAPARPGETVAGRSQVRANFERLVASMPDLHAHIDGLVEEGDRAWMEWSLRGTRQDGTAMLFAGVNIFEISGGALQRGRIYTELARDSGGAAAQIERMTTGSA